MLYYKVKDVYIQNQQCETDCLSIPIASLVTTEPRGSVVDNPCIVESNQVTDCLSFSYHTGVYAPQPIPRHIHQVLVPP